MRELMEQKLQADWIVFATSSGGTHAGLLLGQRVFGYKGKLLGISIDESEEWLKKHVSELASLVAISSADGIDNPKASSARGSFTFATSNGATTPAATGASTSNRGVTLAR